MATVHSLSELTSLASDDEFFVWDLSNEDTRKITKTNLLADIAANITFDSLSLDTLSLAAGTAAAPSLYLNDETDKGLFSPGDDEVGLATLGTERLKIEGDGTLNVSGTTDYETLVLADDDLPNKKYTDDAISTAVADYLPLAGGTMLGDIVLAGAPTIDLHPASKKYTDDADALLLPLAGGTLTGALTLSGAPTADLHASTKKYTDDSITSALVINPNLVGNPSFFINQKGESGYTGLSSATYVHDRWKFNATTSGSVDISTSVGVAPGEDTGGKAPATAVKIEVNSTDASIAAGDFLLFEVGIIDTDLLKYFDNEVTLTFRVRANHTATYTMFARSGSTDGSYVEDFTIDAADTWEKKEITFTVDTNTGTWNDGTTRDIGMIVGFCFMAGTNFQGTGGTWEAANDLGTSGTDNILDTGTNYVEITAVKLEGGSVSTPYVDPDWNEEYDKSQAYYQQSYPYGTKPGTASFDTGMITFYQEATGVFFYRTFLFSKKLINDPTMSIYSIISGTIDRVHGYSPGDQVVSSVTASENGIQYITMSSSQTAGNRYGYQWTALAEII